MHSILESLGFKYVADLHGDVFDEIKKARSVSNLFQVPTNILGEPGGVGYIENLRARGMGDKFILKDFESKLKKRKIAVVYEHPSYAGIKELPMVEKMIRSAQSMGFRITTLRDIVNYTCGQEIR